MNKKPKNGGRKGAKGAETTGSTGHAGSPMDVALLERLVKLMAQYPRTIEAAALAHEPHRIAFYLNDLASAFHSLWNRGNDDPERRFLLADRPDVTRARLELARGVARIIRSGLALMGVEAAEEMR